MIKYESKDENQLVDEIRKDFLLKLAELSQDWEPPAFSVNLGWGFISSMIRESLKFNSDIHWIEYYNFRGINPESTQYILPSDLKSAGKEEYDEKRVIIDSHLTQAVWPIIKSGERPPQLVRRFIKMKMSGGIDWDTHLWYWAISDRFKDWYFHIYMKYIDSIPDFGMQNTEAFERALSRYDENGELQALPTWFNMQCLNWWLSWQKISLNTNEIKELYDEAGLSRTSYDIER